MRPIPAKALDEFLALALTNAAAMLDELCGGCSANRLVVVQQADLKAHQDRLVDGVLARWHPTISASRGSSMSAAGYAAPPAEAFALPPMAELAQPQQRALASHGLR